jgi:predicted phage terminase large subunit-like protein
VVLPAPREYQVPVLASAARNKVLLCGRRWGKTKVALLCALEGHGPTRGFWRGALQGARIGWFVPSYEHPSARDVWVDLKAAAGRAALRVSEDERTVVLPGGGSVQVISGHDPDAARGIYLDGAVLDECSLQQEALWTEGVRATLADYGGWAVFAGTVPADVRTHWFVRLFGLAEGPLRSRGWECWRRPSGENPQFGPAEQAAARLEVGTRVYLREYGAELVAAEGGVWKDVWYAERRWRELPALTRVVVAVDSAWKTGVRNDFSCVQTWGRTATDYYLVDEWHGRVESPALRRRIADQRAKAEAVAAASGAGVSVHVEDVSGGSVQIQELAAAVDFPVLPYPIKGQTLMARAEAVAPLSEAGKVWIPDARVAPWVGAWLDEVVGFPELAHDDRVAAKTIGLGVLRGSVAAERVVVRPSEATVAERGCY